MRPALIHQRVAEPLFGDPISDWLPWFAWKPVRTFDRRLVWLRWVCRRCIHKHEHLFGGDDFWWQYALPAKDPTQ
jgi:hypothetical protein